MIRSSFDSSTAGEFPGGRRVLANTILEIEDGRIVRERDVVCGDAKS